MLSIRSEIGYIHEPFNRNHGIEGIDHWFLYLKEGLPGEPAYAALIQDLLAGRAAYRRAPLGDGGPLRRAAIALLRSRHHVEYLRATRNPWVKRLLIKDPIACLSSEYLHRKFAMQVVIIVRHPAAFVASLQRMSWQADVGSFLDQPALIEDHLSGILGAKHLNELSPVERGALQWNCIYSTLTTFAQRNPGMITVRHEDLSNDPGREFRQLYERLAIPYSRKCQKRIEAHTRQSNPAAPVEGQLHTLKRDSRANVKRWKEVLTPEEIGAIRQITGGTWETYYSDDDW